VLAGGRVAARGRTADVLEHLDLGAPADRLGAASVVEARVIRHDAAYQLTWLDLSGQTLVVPRREHFEEGEPACVVIRARDVSLATCRPQGVSIQNVLAGRVGEVREDADSPFAEVAVEVGPHRLLARVTRLSLHELGLAAGSPVFALLKSVSQSKLRPSPGSPASSLDDAAGPPERLAAPPEPRLTARPRLKAHRS
jgi:molybdate transport system ATP-binding protein